MWLHGGTSNLYLEKRNNTTKRCLEKKSSTTLIMYITCLESRATSPGFKISAFYICKSCFTSFLFSRINKKKSTWRHWYSVLREMKLHYEILPRNKICSTTNLFITCLEFKATSSGFEISVFYHRNFCY